MKKLASTILILLVVFTVQAQKKVEKSVNVSKNENLFLHVKFAHNIEVKQWNQQKFKVDASVLINNGEGNDHYSLKTSKSEGEVKIYSDFGDYFKKKKSWNSENKTTINYTIYVPKNATLKVKSISGSLTSDNYLGDLKTDLISGDITIKKYNGELFLKTISGDVDVVINKAKVNAKTVTGTIYSNLDIDTDFSENKSYSSKIKGTVNNGSTLLKMSTVSGNIYMRKSK